MGLQKTGALMLTILIVSPAEASGLYDPRFCYVLDIFLLAYGIIITVLFLREKCCKSKDKMQSDSIYTTLSGHQSTYDDLRKRDPEMGRGHGGRRQGDDDTYTHLKDKTEDTYRSIQPKKTPRPNNQIYQGLSSATKDTYDSLNMRQLASKR